MDEKAQLLLADIVKLLRKHGPMAFSCLSEAIERGEFLRHVEVILAEGAKGGEKAGIKKGTSRVRKSIRGEISELCKKQPEKGQLLIDFYDGLIAKRYLPHLRDLRHFAAEFDLPEITATSRARAVAPLIRELCKIPVRDLEDIFTTISRVEQSSEDRSLAGWSELILRRSPNAQDTGDESQSSSMGAR